MTVVELHIDGPGIGEFWPAQRVRAHGESEEAAVSKAMQRAVDDDATFGADSVDDLEVEQREVLQD